MRITSKSTTNNLYSNKLTRLIKGDIPKVAPRQIDQVEDINFNESKQNHRVSFKYNKDIHVNIAHIINNSTGETVKKLPSDAQVDQMIRLKRLKELYLEKVDLCVRKLER